MYKSIVFTLSILESSLAFTAEHVPAGEKAHFDVIKDSSRTSSIIVSGEFDSVVKDGVSQDNKVQYPMELDYTLKIRLKGTQSGTKEFMTEPLYYQEEFLKELREKGAYESTSFKIKHMGMVSVTTADGNTYEDCDQLYIYDIAMGEENAWLLGLLRSINGLGGDSAKSADFEDVTVLAKIKFGVPVMGAVQFDVTGRSDGFRFKMGLDYAK